MVPDPPMQVPGGARVAFPCSFQAPLCSRKRDLFILFLIGRDPNLNDSQGLACLGAPCACIPKVCLV